MPRRNSESLRVHIVTWDYERVLAYEGAQKIADGAEALGCRARVFTVPEKRDADGLALVRDAVRRACDVLILMAHGGNSGISPTTRGVRPILERFGANSITAKWLLCLVCNQAQHREDWEKVAPNAVVILKEGIVAGEGNGAELWEVPLRLLQGESDDLGDGWSPTVVGTGL